jgi:hypothetical protein
MLHPSPSLWFVTRIIFDEGYRCYLPYHSEHAGRLYPRCVGPYFVPDLETQSLFAVLLDLHINQNTRRCISEERPEPVLSSAYHHVGVLCACVAPIVTQA